MALDLQIETINFIINIKNVNDSIKEENLNFLLSDNVTFIAQNLSPKDRLTALEYACSKDFRNTVRALLALKVSLSSKIYSLIETYNYYIKCMLISELKFKDLSAGIIKNLLSSIKTFVAIRKLQRLWRKQRLRKASLRMNIIKAELQAVIFSPERLAYFLPQRVDVAPKKEGNLIRQIVTSLKPIFK